PAVVKLRGPHAVYSLLVTGKTSDGRLVDLTHDAAYRSAQPTIAKVGQGIVRALADGKTELTVEVLDKTAKVQVEVQDARAPHGGGIRIRAGTDEYELLRGWMAAGMPMGDPAAPGVTSIRVEPAERVMGMKASQQLRVIARYADLREVDVTGHARYQANNEGL